MFTLKELNPKGFPLTKEMEANQVVLQKAMNIFRAAYGKPMYVLSGVRSIDDQKRIYMEIAKAKGIKNPRIPMSSMHLIGAAVDIVDTDRAIYDYCKAHPEVLEAANVFVEEDHRDGGVHFQCFPFKSYKPGGSRWFLP